MDSKESRNGTFEDSIYHRQLFGDLLLKEQNGMAINVENEGKDICLSVLNTGKIMACFYTDKKKKKLHSLE